MNIVFLSGGSGKRLWPLSNDVRSKQFIKLFKSEEGVYESMLQRVFRQCKAVDKDAQITIATGKSQISQIHNQLGNDIDISVEPDRRDTFPAIVLAISYLKDVKKIGDEEVAIVCPIDPYVNEDYFESLKELEKLAKTGSSNLYLMGIEPTYPSEKYGYIIPSSKEKVSTVESFKEKPDLETAKKYLEMGALWNSGVFAFKIGYLMEVAHKLIDFENYYDLYQKYSSLEKISFDYALVEKEKNITVLRFSGEWKDLGTWNTFSEAMSEPIIGNGVMNDTCKNVNIINQLDMPILAMGLENVIIAAGADGIIVTDKEQSSYIKPYVDAFDERVMYAEKSWGSYQVLDITKESMTIKVTLKPGHSMNYHSHERRDEVWAVIEGKGKTIVDGMEQLIQPGDVITMMAGCRHTVIAETELKLIEVQLGKDIDVNDKQKYTFE